VHITIQSDELAAFRASNPALRFGGLVDVTFEFDEDGEVAACYGTAADNTTTVAMLEGPPLAALYQMAKHRFIKQLRNLDRKSQGAAAILPFRKAVAA
jgi:hypothetical protein